MSHIPLDARDLEERLQEVALRVREIRGLLLVDSDGLPLVSTLGARGLEDSLAAFTGAIQALLERARQDFQMGPLNLLRLAGRDRQIFVVPVTRGLFLLGVAETGATPSTVEAHLVALARSVLESVLEGLVRPPGAETTEG
ncbi:MAG: roadblock/LC7 domain-containing protein [Thermoanaerobaculia bacterium]|nr:roadblock/LC7 domain-containing protein [Thermoanaerobaculia bacterium]MCZ7650140.1 roadblock/LC7 domain-containing protein [Thermoanaerobaculia bacterium]